MTQVEPRFKPDTYGACGCGCGKEGRYRKKPWTSNGVLCVTNCDRKRCPQCRGAASKSGGGKKQALVRKRVGGTQRFHGAGHEENWQGPCLTEVKSGTRDAQVVATAYERERAQAETKRSIGDPRPFMASYAPKGTKRSYHVLRDDELEPAAVALCESWGYRVESA
jgi:hypothetical protein